MGTDLFRAVFQGPVRTLLDKCRGQLEVSPNLGLRLKIKIDPQDQATGALADLPWELLCDNETEDFFALSRHTSLVRYLDVPRSSQPIPFEPPLRILAVSASPEGMRPLDLQRESRLLEELNQSSSGVEVQFLHHASAGVVREVLSEDTYNVLHFMGHGTFDPASGDGMLAFEKPNGTPDLVSGKAFATKLKDLRSLGVVTLNACETARARHQAGANPFRGVATALVLGGIPAVVAMQRPISDSAAISFTSAFYRYLARGDSIDVALTEGRQAIHFTQLGSFEWATPVLFLRLPEGQVFVAKPKKPPEQRELRLPAPEFIGKIPSAPVTGSSGGGWILKFTAGTGNAALLIFALSTKLLSFPSGLVQPVSTVTEARQDFSISIPDTQPTRDEVPVSNRGPDEPHWFAGVASAYFWLPQYPAPQGDASAAAVPPPVTLQSSGATAVSADPSNLKPLSLPQDSAVPPAPLPVEHQAEPASQEHFSQSPDPSLATLQAFDATEATAAPADLSDTDLSAETVSLVPRKRDESRHGVRFFLRHPFEMKKEQVASCVRQRAWMAYFQNEAGELGPVRDTQNTDNDEDWLCLRFTDYDGPRIRLGVLKVLSKTPEADDQDRGRIEVPVAGVQEMLTTALYNTERLDVIEQKRIQEVESQQTRKEITEPTPSSIRNMGKVLGAQYLVYGTVNEWTPDRASRSMEPSGLVSAGRREAEVAITFTLTDVGSGQILFTTSERARLGDWNFSSGRLSKGSAGIFQKTMVGYTVRACANKAALKIAIFLRDRKWKGSVVDIRGNDFYINAGSQQGMAPEMMLSVQSLLGIVKDPQSGTVLGEDLRGIGTLKVIAVQNGFSVARVTDGCKGIKKGDRVELATEPVPPLTIPECDALDGTRAL